MGASTDLLGTLLEGRYLVQDRIARGGMSTVYRGVDTRLDRPVAIKVMDPAYADDPEFLHRFAQEARAVARLSHSGLVAVHDQGTDGEHAFLVMELVEGGTVRELLREQGATGVEVAFSILEPVLAALSTAHRAGLVHRDVKPENVLIADDGTVKVADFGLVRAVAAAGPTSANVILGTVAYLSPEQVATGHADPRSDVYSAGILLYELLTGAAPYSGDTPLSVAFQHVNNDVPSPGARTPGIPAELDAVVVRATRRDAAQRYRDAGEMLGALLAARRALGLRRVRVPTPHRAPGRAAPWRAAEPVQPTRALTAATRRETVDEPGWGERRDTLRPGTVQPDTLHANTLSPGATASVPTLNAYQRERRRARRTTLIWFVVVLVLAAAVGVGAWWLGSGRFTAVPQLAGLTSTQAQRALNDADLKSSVRTGYDDTAVAKTVLSAQPGVGTKVERGSQVVLQVSLGRPAVPEVKPGTDAGSAEQAVRAVSLVPTSTQGGYDDTVPAGAVLGTDPPAGTTARVGATVTLRLSQGAAPVAVPDVTSRAIDDAGPLLRAAGLVVGSTTSEFSASVPGGDVVRTDPVGGSEADKGSKVDVVVSSALTVPDVTGQDPVQARRALSAAGLTPVDGGPTSSGDAGKVAVTSPPGGTLVDPASPQVRVVVSNAVKVPDVRGSSVDDARKKLRKLGLGVDVNQLVPLGRSRVINQNPSAGSDAVPGSTVTLTAFP